MFSADLGGYTTPLPAATDPPFQKVALLLHGDGTNGAQNNTFVDSSTNNFTITRTGNVAQGTFSPFSLAEGQWSNYFDGTGDYLSVADSSAFTLGSGDFTIEAWIYPLSLPSSGSIANIAAQWASSANSAWLFAIYNNGGTIQLLFQPTSGGTETVISKTYAFVTNSFYHVVAVRNSNVITLYVNGTAIGTSTSYSSTIDDSTTALTIGSRVSGALPFTGYISNLRIVKGSAVYTGNFTPSTTPLTAVSGTSLLTCQSNRFIDNSSNNFTITPYGDTKVTAFSPFAPSAAYDASTNGGSGYFDGTGDYLSIPDSTDFDLNSTFTVDCWYYQPAAGNATFFCRGGGAGSWSTSNGHEYLLFIESGTLYWQWNTSGSPSNISITAPAAGAWHHLAVGYNGTTTRVWVDGASIGSSTSAYTLPTTRNITRVGLNPAGPNALNGYSGQVRVIKGTDVYGVSNTSITVPTSPLTAITNTKLLLDYTNAGIYDNAGKNDIETVGNAQISTSVKKYGTGSMYFDGTGDWLYLADRPELQLGTGNFTIEGWIYLGTTGAAQGIVSKGTSTTGWLLSVNTSNQIVFTYSSSTITSTGTLSGSTWYHIAVCREGTGTNQTKIYINGSNDGTGTVSTNFNQTNVMYVGADRTGGSAMNGYIDDLRITLGQALYTSNFTPPTQAFSNV